MRRILIFIGLKVAEISLAVGVVLGFMWVGNTFTLEQVGNFMGFIAVGMVALLALGWIGYLFWKWIEWNWDKAEDIALDIAIHNSRKKKK